MHPLKISAGAAMLMLVAPIAAGHSAKGHSGQTGSGKMMCADMHAKMHEHMEAMKGKSAKGAPAMKCMAEKPAHAAAQPPASPAPPVAHDHDHAGAQPPK